MNEKKFWTKSYDEHVPVSLEYENKDMATILIEGMKRFPENIGFYFMELEITYREVYEFSVRFATYLQKKGIKKGDVVAINLPNCPQYLFAFYGAVMAGAVVSGLSPLLSKSEIVYQMEDCGAKVLITLDALYEKVFTEILDKLKNLKLVITTNIADFMGFSKIKVFLGKLLRKIPTGKVEPFKDIEVIDLSETFEAPMNLKKPNIDPEKDLLLLQYTGGTTGTPKGVEIKHISMVRNLHQFATWLDREEGREVVISAFPYFHLAGLFIGMFLTYISASHVIIANPRDTDHLIKEIIKTKPTIFANVPTLFLMIQKNPKSKEIPEKILENIGLYFSGASPFPAEAVKDFERDFHSENKFVEVYGLTETSVLVTVNPVYGKKKIGTVGIPLPDTKVKILDVDTREECPIGKAGEIVVTGPQVSTSYRNKPEATEATFIDGWVYTGDVGVFDEDGYLKIVDRTKDMISVSGYKVYSVHVENVLTKHPNIELIAIIGVPNPERPGSEIVKAIIQLKEGIELSDKVKSEIEDYAEKSLAKYEVPKIWEYQEELPLTAVGKISKPSLRKNL
ncbi:MAG: AMP-binding protein [Candidatus Lokiarchaeota archaeon]|nr:AMP-binding protein [Candidatus Lokiarchaeota archaeon]MBD3340622.1 AMP-binding protein [Candidatus Lokiarchaeota archaeon]